MVDIRAPLVRFGEVVTFHVKQGQAVALDNLRHSPKRELSEWRVGVTRRLAFVGVRAPLVQLSEAVTIHVKPRQPGSADISQLCDPGAVQ